jgi:uncharacterized protein YcnI
MRLGLAALFLAPMAFAAVPVHVTLAPVESKLGAVERYTVRAPTEGQVATVGIEVDVPAGVTVSSVLASPGWTSEVRKEGARIVGISWKVNIPPSHFGELVFNARNPRQGSELTWNVRQVFADGTSREWTPQTKLVAEN